MKACKVRLQRLDRGEMRLRQFARGDAAGAQRVPRAAQGEFQRHLIRPLSARCRRARIVAGALASTASVWSPSVTTSARSGERRRAHGGERIHARDIDLVQLLDPSEDRAEFVWSCATSSSARRMRASRAMRRTAAGSRAADAEAMERQGPWDLRGGRTIKAAMPVINLTDLCAGLERTTSASSGSIPARRRSASPCRTCAGAWRAPLAPCRAASSPASPRSCGGWRRARVPAAWSSACPSPPTGAWVPRLRRRGTGPGRSRTRWACPAALWDETLTTSEVHELLIGADLSRKPPGGGGRPDGRGAYSSVGAGFARIGPVFGAAHVMPGGAVRRSLLEEDHPAEGGRQVSGG